MLSQSVKACLKRGCQSALRNKQMLLHASLHTYVKCNTLYVLQLVCRVQLLCMRQQRNVMKQWSTCFWSMEPTSRPGPNTYACSLCARLCTVFLMQLLHALLTAQQCLLLFRKALLQCCCFWQNCLVLLIRDALNNLAPSALNKAPPHPPPDPRLNGPDHSRVMP